MRVRKLFLLSILCVLAFSCGEEAVSASDFTSHESLGLTESGQRYPAVYKTPHGKKYHLGSCRMVENVSEKLSKQDIRIHNLGPCSFCHPPIEIGEHARFVPEDKSVQIGERVRCNGVTQKGKRCKRHTTLANGHCWQHHPKDVEE